MRLNTTKYNTRLTLARSLSMKNEKQHSFETQSLPVESLPVAFWNSSQSRPAYYSTAEKKRTFNKAPVYRMLLLDSITAQMNAVKHVGNFPLFELRRCGVVYSGDREWSALDTDVHAEQNNYTHTMHRFSIGFYEIV